MKYIAIVFFSLLWFLGCSDSAADYLIGNRIVPSDYRYGDLYRLSNLRKFRVPVAECKNSVATEKLPIAIHLAGDSFTEPGRINGPEFKSEYFSRSFVAASEKTELKKGVKNLLIIQTVERHFRERFNKPWEGVYFMPKVSAEKDLWDRISSFELPYITERHESLLFAFDFTLRIKEAKAWINKSWFHRVSEKVALSEDEEHLLYYLPSEAGISSNYSKLSESEIAAWVASVNQTRENYLSQGYDEVILSIIPNKTSILSGRDDDYNHLIERIQNHPSLEMPFIDMYSPLKKGGASLFDKGDTHWNCDGKQIWIDKVNAILALQVE